MFISSIHIGHLHDIANRDRESCFHLWYLFRCKDISYNDRFERHGRKDALNHFDKYDVSEKHREPQKNDLNTIVSVTIE